MVGWIKRCLLRGGDPQPMAKVAIDLIPKFSLCPALKTINAIGVDTSNIIIPRAMCYERPPSVAVVATGRGVASFICFLPSRSEGGGGGAIYFFVGVCALSAAIYLYLRTHITFAHISFHPSEPCRPSLEGAGGGLTEATPIPNRNSC